MRNLIRTLGLLALTLLTACLPSSCGATASRAADGTTNNAALPAFSMDLVNGVCAKTPDGKYTASYNPLTKAFTLKAAVMGNVVKDLAYDSGTKTWRADLPDGSAAVYGVKGLIIEPPLPVPPRTGKEVRPAGSPSP